MGAELKKIIAEKLDLRYQMSEYISGDRGILEALTRHTQQTRDMGVYQKKCWQIRDGLPIALSIDNFIDAHAGDKQLEFCGKLGIARSILEAEANSALFFDPQNSREGFNFEGIEDTWFVRFAQLLFEGVRKEDLSGVFQGVSFINFNYDRCVEHFIRLALKTYYGLDDQNSTLIANSLPVLHPYGVVGKLPWQPGEGKPVSFGDPAAQNTLDVVTQLKTFTEQVDAADNQLALIKDALAQAEIIVFLGFAFHAQNIRLIAPANPRSGPRIFATAYGISSSDCSEIQSLLAKSFVPNNVIIRNDLKCEGLLSEHWRSLSSSY